MPAPQIVLDLVERFECTRDAYKSPAYNETQLRREFLDPFFEALGWDVNNRQGYAEAYKDVIHGRCQGSCRIFKLLLLRLPVDCDLIFSG